MALDRLFNRKEFKEYKAIILGGLPKKIKKKIKNIDNFEFKGYVSTEELEILYANAYAFFYPSLNEGFGYPPLEAMKYGTPIVASSIASIPEVCASAAIYFNPFLIEEMTARLIEVTVSNHSDLQNKSLKQYKFIKEKQNKDLDKLIKWILG
jgi:glycosyltransferase involved in cell wall biosynthesis